MAFDLEEQEKIDQLKAWWLRFGGFIMGVLVVISLVFIGYYGWGWYQNYRATQALGYYDIVNNTANASQHSSEDNTRMKEALKALQADYKGTAYPARASLLASKFFMEQGKYEEAQHILQWVVSESGETEIIPVAQLQLATAFLNQDNYADALAQLSNPPTSFNALFLDRRADILLAQNKKDEAAQVWQTVLQEKNVEASFIRLVQLKLNVLTRE